MSHIIIGTAGHIDHGKTTLIKALTGIETDRLAEEKKRGITIDLGFAFFDMPSGKRAGIIDVPGHEKFIKNMLAGISGIDLVLLVVAADEGVMPQTREHFDILKLLEVKSGIVVITKCDLVDGEWLDLVKEQIDDLTKGSLFEKAPRIPVSAVTGEGISQLVDAMEELSESIEKATDYQTLRLPIDRVFSLTGFGTVVTGTLTEGKIHLGDSLMVYPQMQTVKVRGIQVHGKDVEQADSGQRVAVNISNLKTSDLSRGDLLAKPDSLSTTMMIDVLIEILPDYARELPNWTRLRLYAGTKELMCRLVLLDRDVIKPGETALAQLRLEETAVFKYSDKVILRLFSPLETVGGAKVLDPTALKHKRYSELVLSQLLEKESGGSSAMVMGALLRISDESPSLKQISQEAGVSIDETQVILDQAVLSDQVVQVVDRYFHRDFLDRLEVQILQALNDFHKKNPLKAGIVKEELRTRVFKASKVKIFDELLNIYLKKDMIVMLKQFVALKQFEIVLNQEEALKKKRLVEAYHQFGYVIVSTSEVLKSQGLTVKDQAFIDFILLRGDLVKLDEGLMIHSIWLGDAKSKLLTYFETHDYVEIGVFRDLLGCSRKVAVSILEYFDSIQLTVRNDLQRRLK